MKLQKLSTTLAITAGALLIAPAAGNAATTFGHNLTNSPIDGSCKNVTPPCTYVPLKQRTQGGNNIDAGSPVDGVIVKFRLRAYNDGDGPGTARLGVASLTIPNPNSPENGVGKLVSLGAPVSIQDDSDPIQEFPARLSVAKGQRLAMETSTVNAIDSNGDGSSTHVFSPALVAGQQLPTTDTTGQLIMQAIVEPDADKDGFGDESQDGCPANAERQTAPCVDTVKPTLGGAKVSGGALNVTLSEAAKLSIKIERKTTGRKVKGKCKKATRKNRFNKKCKRYVKVKTVNAQGVAGLNKVALKIKKKGSYRLKVTATDKAGNKSTKTLSFRVR